MSSKTAAAAAAAAGLGKNRHVIVELCDIQRETLPLEKQLKLDVHALG
jgi:hypothetical protein